MPFRDILKKKDKIAQIDYDQATLPKLPQASEFTFVRTDTHTEEVIKPPAFDGDSPETTPTSSTTPKRGLSRFRRGSHERPEHESESASPQREHKRLSQRLRLHRSASASSAIIPADLPEVADAYAGHGDQQDKEAQWEERATVLVTRSPIVQGQQPLPDVSHLNLNAREARTDRPSIRPRTASDAASDGTIQDAIRFHEAGELEKATDLFRRLAESGNVLSQVLYGLSLRHGWGCQPDPQRAVTYLSSAASNSASIEAEALKAGMKKGGAAKGELVLAIFELANCYRYGWGVQVDQVAARHYYETAANLGDTDAMNEAAWCYLEGFGGKKDKVSQKQFPTSNPCCSAAIVNVWKHDPR